MVEKNFIHKNIHSQSVKNVLEAWCPSIFSLSIVKWLFHQIFFVYMTWNLEHSLAHKIWGSHPEGDIRGKWPLCEYCVLFLIYVILKFKV